MRTPTFRTVAGLATAAVLTLPLAACSQDVGATPAANAEETSASPLEPAASVPQLTGENTQVKLDAGFAAALEELGLTPGVVGDAELVGGDTLEFPVTGGNVSLFEPGTVDPYVVGQVQHEGSGLSLSAKGTTVEISNLNVDPTVSKVYGDVTVDGKVAASSVPVFNLDGRTLQPVEMQGENAILQGSKVQVSEVAAPLLNETFGTDAIERGLVVGTATITASTAAPAPAS